MSAADSLASRRYGGQAQPVMYIGGIACVRDEGEADAGLRLLTAAELDELPTQKDRIKGVFPSDGLAAIAGPSGSGKTFLAHFLMQKSAAGQEVFGHRTTPCRWTYVGLEGRGGLPKRGRAYREAYGDEGAENVRFVIEPLQITNPIAMERLTAALIEFGAKVVVIDTLNAAAPGLDENASADMGRMIEAAKRLQAAIDGLVILVHHTGKDVSRGLRGHSSLFAALDAVIEVTRDDAGRRWRLAKSKDGADGEEHPFRLRVIELGEDEDGDPITSCVVEIEDAPANEIRKNLPPKGGNARIAYDSIKAALNVSKNFGKGDAPPTRPAITLEAAIAATAERLTVEPKRRRERAQAAITSLVSHQHLAHLEGWIWLP